MVTLEILGDQISVSFVLDRFISKVTKFQIPTPQCLSMVVKSIFLEGGEREGGGGEREGGLSCPIPLSNSVK